jgi:hypothetical protein
MMKHNDDPFTHGQSAPPSASSLRALVQKEQFLNRSDVRELALVLWGHPAVSFPCLDHHAPGSFMRFRTSSGAEDSGATGRHCRPGLVAILHMRFKASSGAEDTGATGGHGRPGLVAMLHMQAVQSAL